MNPTTWNFRIIIPAIACFLLGGATVFFFDRLQPISPPNPPAPAAEITLPPSVTIDIVGKPVKVTGITTGKLIKWHAHDLSLGMVPQDDKSVFVYASTPGTYKLSAYTAINNLPTVMYSTIVTVGTPTPPDPPTPPVPPVPPEPTDPIWPTLKSAFSGEVDKAKVAKLASIYRSAIVVITTAKTQGELISGLHNVAEGYVSGALLKTRRVLADELNSKIPATTTGPLTDALRAQYTAQFNRFAALLEVLAK